MTITQILEKHGFPVRIRNPRRNNFQLTILEKRKNWYIIRYTDDSLDTPEGVAAFEDESDYFEVCNDTD
jgi:hypothetical protein